MKYRFMHENGVIATKDEFMKKVMIPPYEQVDCENCEKLKAEIEVKDAVIIALNDTIRDLKKYCIELGGFFEW